PVTPGGQGATAGAPAAPVELAPIEHPSQLLPRDTAMLVMGASVARAAEVFERDRLVQAFGPQYTSLRSVMTGTLGHDLLDPAQWPAVGLDPQGPVGLAMLDVVSARPILLATIGDPVKLTEFVRSVAGKAGIELVETSYGAAKVLRAKGESGAVLMRDRLVAFVADEGRGGIDLAERLVTMDPNVSLASAVSYRKATGGLRAADLTVYFDVLGMVEQQSAAVASRTSKPQSNWAQDELVEAQKRGDGKERLDELERLAEQERQDQERWRRRVQGEQALAELLVSGIDGVGLTVTVKRSGPIFDGRVVAGEDAFLRRLLSNREGAPVLTRAMGGAPLYCLSGQVEAAAALELAEAIAEADGKEFSGLVAEVKAELGVELPADLPSALGGPSELCVAIEGPIGAEDPGKTIGLGAIVQATDPAKAKYLLAKVASGSGKLASRMRKQGGGYVLQAEDWRDVHLQAQDDRIVIATDPDLAKRLASGDPGSMPSKIRPAGARGAMELPGTAISQVFDLSTGMLWMMAGRASFSGPMMMAPGLTPEELEKVPHSKKSKKAKKVLDKAQAELQALERKRETADMERLTAIMDPLGIMVAAATEDAGGFTITGGQFLRVTSLGQVIEGIMGAALQADSES
ncbi:MAG: hypothetical protein KDK70_39030, partial [Myxococcales bacterium]|nr:hypothetical protein [Myxococcales bacterium]